MKLSKYLVAVGLYAGVFSAGVAFGQTAPSGPVGSLQTPAPGAASDGSLPTFPAPPLSDSPPRQDPGVQGTPVPSSGTGDGYSYAPSDYDGFSIVYPSDGTDPLYVSTNFLESSIRSSDNGSQVVSDAKAYQQMNAQVAEQLEKQFYPDASAGDANIERSVIQGADHDVIIEQDPKAGPYARVTVTDKEGNVISESSMSAAMAKQVAGNPYIDAEKKIAALEKNKFTLPEKARENFDQLSPEELREMVLENPALQEQEFVKYARVMAQVEAEKQGLPGASDGVDDTASSVGEATDLNEAVANRAQRNTDKADVALEPMDTVADNGMRKNAAADRDVELRSESGLGGPEIAGITLGIVALGIFAFGWWKTRR